MEKILAKLGQENIPQIGHRSHTSQENDKLDFPQIKNFCLSQTLLTKRENISLAGKNANVRWTSKKGLYSEYVKNCKSLAKGIISQ